MASSEPTVSHLSALSSLILSSTSGPGSSKTHPPQYQYLAIQTLHNLQYQHDWTSLRIHTHSRSSSDASPKLLPRPLISGVPPHRIYVHPDEQIDMLKAGMKESDAQLEREWVLPCHLREKWSLRKMGQVFDAVGVVPPGLEEEREEDGKKGLEGKSGRGGNGIKKRRGGKRILLGIVGDDSTIVYYIVHDGIVKPRQN